TTVERTDLNQGKLPSSDQVTLGGLREGGGDITLDSQLQGATFRNRVSRRQPELSNSNQTARAQDDIEFRNDVELQLTGVRRGFETRGVPEALMRMSRNGLVV